MKIFDLLKNVFDTVRKSLSPEQRSLIKYPSVNPARVYHTPAGRSYHSVPWCHTINGNCTPIPLEDAKKKHYLPCSKCVEREKTEFPKQLEFFYESH